MLIVCLHLFGAAAIFLEQDFESADRSVLVLMTESNKDVSVCLHNVFVHVYVARKLNWSINAGRENIIIFTDYENKKYKNTIKNEILASIKKAKKNLNTCYIAKCLRRCNIRAFIQIIETMLLNTSMPVLCLKRNVHKFVII